ncbi:WD repeat-containing protein 61, partial [Geodia barretti]
RRVPYWRFHCPSPLSIPSQHASLTGTLSGHSSWVLSVAYCPDNQHFVTGSSDKTVKIWDGSNRECLHTFKDHSDQVV